MAVYKVKSGKIGTPTKVYELLGKDNLANISKVQVLPIGTEATFIIFDEEIIIEYWDAEEGNMYTTTVDKNFKQLKDMEAKNNSRRKPKEDRPPVWREEKGEVRLFIKSDSQIEILPSGFTNTYNVLESNAFKSEIVLNLTKKEILNKFRIDLDSKVEQVKSPKHYNQYPIEVIDMMEKIWGKEKVINFCYMNAYKYRMRIGLKDNPAQDLAKEEWYLNKIKELEQEK